ncbi:MAG TPA: acyl-CoA synthetase FdrA [bacterium]|nr:acyl-CoA synthetase FdrA [bacterium]
MTVRSRIKPSAYFDSVTLMLAQRDVRVLPGVVDAGLVMGTEANKDLLKDAGLLTPEVSAARSDDLVIVVRAETEDAAGQALTRAEELLVRRPHAAGPSAYRPRTVASAVRQLPGANLALISVPGRFAAGVARDALDAGLHVMLFSDNVALEDERDLKTLATGRGLLVMGPDCGTAMIAGAGLGFANHVRSGTIGVVGAAGTGTQVVTSLVHRGGAGISHALGTGSRDLGGAIGGVSAVRALAALAADPGTEVIVLVGKPPAPDVAAGLLAAARGRGKPVVVDFVGAAVPAGGGLYPASTLDEAARIAVRLVTGSEPAREESRALPAQEAARLAPSQRYIRGLYSGGTLCYEALVLLERYVGPVFSNTPLQPSTALASAARSRSHTVIDMGADEFMVGRLHPMIDPDLRIERLLREADDPETAVVLLDVVLGYGAHSDPSRDLVPAIETARRRAAESGRRLPVIVTVCGTDEDPQDLRAQVEALTAAGAVVETAHSEAVRLAGLIAEAAGSRGAPYRGVPIEPAGAGILPDVSHIRDSLLSGPPRVINVGLGLFEESLAAQGVEVVSVDWQPPAGGKQKYIDLLNKLNA